MNSLKISTFPANNSPIPTSIKSPKSTVSSAKETESWKREIDLLFQKHSISELRNIEKKTRQDLELKKQELRLLVGYLIDF